MGWHPSAQKSAIVLRAHVYERIRHFFSQHQVVEVETPILGITPYSRDYTRSLEVDGRTLQSSPSVFMQSLLALGMGDIFQITKIFKPTTANYSSTIHEYSTVEWYRAGYDTWAMMEEMANVLDPLLANPHFDYVSYRQIVDEFLGLSPFTATEEQLRFEAMQHTNIDIPRAQKDDWLQLLFDQLIVPHLGKHAPVFIYDLPKCQAGLAKLAIDEQGNKIAECFCLYYRGVLLGQGYLPITNSDELHLRFQDDNHWRESKGLAASTADADWIKMIEQGLPNCAGASIAIDALLMLRLGLNCTEQVISFSYTH